jgi:outer membrane immunogenic protein
MKKCLLLSTASVLLAGSAIAADLPVKAPIVAAVPGCAQFGGFYVGGNVGWKYRTNDWKDKDNFGFNFTGLDHVGDGTETANSWEAGVQSGYNFQFHCTVWGIQGDWNWTGAKVSNYFTEPNGAAFPGTFAYSSKEKSFGTLRTRSGVVVDNLLLYITGGLAWADFNRNLSYTGFDVGTGAFFSQTFSSSKTRLGFAVGAGAEWALGPNWSIVSEILYMGFEKDNPGYVCNSPVSPCFGGTAFRYEFKDNEWVARVGVNYRFGGWGAPLLAR